MVRKYKRKTNRGNVSLEKLMQAFKAVSEDIGFQTAAKKFGIDQMTLKQFIKRQLQTPADQTILTGLSHHAEMKQVLDIVYKTELASQITNLSDSLCILVLAQTNAKKLLMNLQKQMGYQF